MSKCRNCGREIVWAISPSGRNIPLERMPVIYTVKRGPTRLLATAIEPDSGEAVYISHFRTCPGTSLMDQSKAPEQQSFEFAEAEG